MPQEMSEIKRALLEKGVRMPNPHSVDITEDIHADRISGNGVVLHAGTRLVGNRTLILDGAVLGYEQPVTVENCYVGPLVRLNGGFFRDAVFLKGATMASGAHVREGCILEEHAGAGHCVGIKQTILFPYVTLGSQINFCDCLMSGGTGRKHHSEVGSSYIHFNFTPQQDKATPSLIGDVPRGVMLDQPPVFLGGQGGLIGPARLGFGITIAAGTIFRKDELRPNRLIFEGPARGGDISYKPGTFRDIRRIVINNLIYIGNLVALSRWYTHVRGMFISDDFPATLHEGMQTVLAAGVAERVRRLDEFVQKIYDSNQSSAHGRSVDGKISGSEQANAATELTQKWPDIAAVIEKHGRENNDHRSREAFFAAIQDAMQKYGRDYLTVIHSLEEKDRRIGTEWLQQPVDMLIREAISLAPFLQQAEKGISS